jgi:hypothetical protein
MGEASPTSSPFQRWMLGALLLGLGLGGPALWGYLDHQARWQRPAPKSQLCAIGVGRLLRAPVLVAPSEPFPGRDGATVYLTGAQYKAVQCANALSNGTDKDLAHVLAETDPEVQAKAIVDLTIGRLAKPETEADAVSLYHMASAVLEGLPASDAMRAERRRLDEALGCAFVGPRMPSCAARPEVPTWVWALGGIGGFALALVPASLLQRLLSRFMKKRDAKPAGAAKPAASDAKGDDAASDDASSETKRDGDA